jgi:hypothetical protein
MPSRALFLALICIQAAHSVEEYLFRLYADFLPAQIVSSLFSPDPRRGFVAGNALLILVGLACYFGPVRRGWPAATAAMWFWSLLEALNGFGHLARSLLQGRYTAGAATALPLLAVALLLARQLLRDPKFHHHPAPS